MERSLISALSWDIGVHQDGLVHISQMTERYIKHPLEAVSVGDIVEVQVLESRPGKEADWADHENKIR